MSADMNAGSIGLVVVSPRVPAGLMTRDAWSRIESAGLVLGRDAEEPLVEAVTEAGLEVELVADVTAPDLARRLVAAADEQDVVWLGSSDADPGLTDALAGELTRLDSPPPVEVVVGSWDAPGARLLDAVAVMDTLRSPGGCPWDAKQTHASLAPYLVEEAFEVVEAIGEQDSSHLEEELGDVLLQVLFHARVASERADDGFDIDAVDEKPERDAEDPLAGVPTGLPPLERATKYVSRLTKAGHGDLVADVTSGDSLGPALLDLVVQARELGVDPSVALATALSDLDARVGARRSDPST